MSPTSEQKPNSSRRTDSNQGGNPKGDTVHAAMITAFATILAAGLGIFAVVLGALVTSVAGPLVKEWLSSKLAGGRPMVLQSALDKVPLPPLPTPPEPKPLPGEVKEPAPPVVSAGKPHAQPRPCPELHMDPKQVRVCVPIDPPSWAPKLKLPVIPSKLL